MLYCGLRYNNTINDISRKRTYDEKSGVYTSRPENINGNWGIGGNIYYTNKLFKKIFARLATNANYNRRVSYVQIMGEANENDRNTSQMLSLMQDVEFAYKLEEHEFKINGAITYQQADNSYTNNSDYRTYDFYLLLSGKTQKSIKSSSKPRKIGLRVLFFKSKPLNRKDLVLVVLLHLLCKEIIPGFLGIFHECDKIDVVHEHKSYHGNNLRECTVPLDAS